MRSITERRRNNGGRGAAWLTRFAALVFWIAVWLFAAHYIGSDLLLPAPWKVVRELFVLVQTSAFWQAIAYTGIKILTGFFSAVGVGCLLAALSGACKYIKILVYPLMAAMKSVPVASFVILALFWLDSASLSVFIAFVMVLPVIYINVLAGIDACDEKILEAARVFRVSTPAKAAFVYLPQVFPYLRSGLAVSLGLCWKAGVAAELIGIPRGSVGEQLYFSKIYFQTADLIAWTVVILLLSVCFEKLFLWLLDRIFAWYERV